MEKTCVKWNFLQNGYLCVLKDIVDVKMLLDKNLIRFIGSGIHASYYVSFVEFYLKLIIGPISENQQFSTHPKCLN